MTATEDFMTSTLPPQKRFHGNQEKQGPCQEEEWGSILGWWTHSLLETIYLRWALLAGGEALTGRGHRGVGGRCDGND